MIKGMTFTYHYGDSGEEYTTAMITSLDEMLNNSLLDNALSLATLMGCSFCGIYDRKGRTVAYGVDADYTKAFGMIRCGKIQQCLHEDDNNKLIFLHVLDSDVFIKLRDNTITSLRACIAQQVVFPNYPEVKEGRALHNLQCCNYSRTRVHYRATKGVRGF